MKSYPWKRFTLPMLSRRSYEEIETAYRGREFAARIEPVRAVCNQDRENPNHRAVFQ